MFNLVLPVDIINSTHHTITDENMTR